MPNVAAVLKQEIARIARREIKVAVNPLRKRALELRRTTVVFKRRIASCERALAELQKQAARGQPAAGAEPAAPEERKPRFTVKGLRSLQRRLRVSGAELARLLGVSTQAVYAWGRQQGALRLRRATRQAVLELRRLGAREARRRLEAMGKDKPRRAPRQRRTARRRR